MTTNREALAKALALVRAHVEIKKRQMRDRAAHQSGYESLMEFIPRVTPKFERPEHLKPVVDLLERVDTEPMRVIYMVPPRNGKTETVLHAIARFIERNPTKTVAYCTYAQRFANKSARAVQRLLKENGVKAGDVKTVTEWRTREGGGLLATGIGGPLTGYGVDLLVIDDVLKDRKSADSPLIRERQWEWFEDVAETRLEPGASVVVLMTRWHEDDIVGRIMEKRPGEYTALRIPAIADGLDAFGKAPAPDPLGRPVGAAIWPNRRGGPESAKAYFEKIRQNKPGTFDALYQGLPRSKDEKLFPSVTYYYALPPGLRFSVGVDLAYSESTRANFTGVTVIGWHFEPGVDADTGLEVMVGTGYVVFAEKWRAEMSETRSRLWRLQQRYPQAFGMEANGPQKGIVKLLREGDSNGLKRIKAIPMIPVQDKYAKWQGYSEAWKAGRIMLPAPLFDDEGQLAEGVTHGIDSRRWLEGFLDEHYNATGINDPFDDWVDSTWAAYELMPPAPPITPKPASTTKRRMPDRDRGARGRRM